jgi:hypothetical protein
MGGKRSSKSEADAIKYGRQRFITANSSDVRIDECPAWALVRVFNREPTNGIDPEEEWPARWAAAGADASDSDWLPWEGDAKTGRGVALKSSGIWQALGNGAGGYNDTLHNPFDPLVIGTGFRMREITREETESLGLLKKNEPAKPADIRRFIKC